MKLVARSVLVIYPDKKQKQLELKAKKQSSPTFVSHLYGFAAPPAASAACQSTILSDVLLDNCFRVLHGLCLASR
jgi:hypothetical protein